MMMDDDEHVDPGQLPQAILDYIAANYPDATITKAELDDGKYEVTAMTMYLSNGLELYFSLDGTFIGLDDDDDSDDGNDDDDDSDEGNDDDDDGDSDEGNHDDDDDSGNDDDDDDSDNDDDDDEGTTTTMTTTIR